MKQGFAWNSRQALQEGGQTQWSSILDGKPGGEESSYGKLAHGAAAPHVQTINQAEGKFPCLDVSCLQSFLSCWVTNESLPNLAEQLQLWRKGPKTIQEGTVSAQQNPSMPYLDKYRVKEVFFI